MAGVMAVLMALAGAGDALAAKSSRPGPALNALIRQTNALPRALGTKAQHRKLNRAARKARRSLKRHACVSVRQLARYRRTLARG